MNYFKYSIIGPRRTNQDKYYVKEIDGRIYAAIADGVGSLENGGLTSDFAVNFFKENIISFSSNKEAFLIELNSNLIDFAKKNEIEESVGSTFTAIEVKQNKLKGIHVGDSRVSILRGNGIKQITEEHNEIGILKQKGIIADNEQVFFSNNPLYHFIGRKGLFNFQTFEFDLEVFDRIILSTDGFHETISKKDLRDISIKYKSFNEFNRQVIIEIESRILKDNCSYVSIEI